VASIYSVGLGFMNGFVQSFLSRYPQANVRVEYQHPERVYELVESDQTDFGLVSYPRSSRTIKCIPWREEAMALVCAPRHPLATYSSVALSDLEGVRMVGFDDNLEIRHHIDRTLANARVNVELAMEFDNIETIKRAIEIDLGVGLLPRFTAEGEVQAGTLVAVPIRGVDLRRPVGIIQRRGKELGQTARRFIQLLRASDVDVSLSSEGPTGSNGESNER
jgi:DNA-binding transcriptional LysR family regulator